MLMTAGLAGTAAGLADQILWITQESTQETAESTPSEEPEATEDERTETLQ